MTPKAGCERPEATLAQTKYALECIWLKGYIFVMRWAVLLHTAFEPEFAGLPEIVQDELLAHARLLEMFGPQLGRPRVDTLNGSKHANMKELRFDADNGVWRVAFAFDPERRAILLIAGDKAGTSEKRFYRLLINQADERFDAHLHELKSATRGRS